MLRRLVCLVHTKDTRCAGVSSFCVAFVDMGVWHYMRVIFGVISGAQGCNEHINKCVRFRDVLFPYPIEKQTTSISYFL